MSDLIERIDHDIDGCDDEVCDSCDLLRDCRAEIEHLQKRNALLEDVAVAADSARTARVMTNTHLQKLDDALDKLREAADTDGSA